jgi:hypothetical protein
MEQDNLKILEVTLKELREMVLEDSDIKEMFLKHYPELDFEEAVDRTLSDLYDYAIQKNYNVLELSLKGAELFFSSVLSNLDEDDEELEIDEGDKNEYGKA